MNDNELRDWCITNYYKIVTNVRIKECDDFIERHNGNTLLFG